MSTISQLFDNAGAPVQLLAPADLAGLGIGAAFATAPIVISALSPVPLNLLVGQQNGFKTANSALGSNPVIRLWLSTSLDGSAFGGSYGTHVLGGAKGAFTMPANTGNLILLTQIPINAAAQVEVCQPYDVLQDLTYLPKSAVLIVENQTGVALDATAPGDLYYLAGNLQF